MTTKGRPSSDGFPHRLSDPNHHVEQSNKKPRHPERHPITLTDPRSTNGT